MKDSDEFVIPTFSKTRISQSLSYPIGAELITQALAAVPQLSALRLRFFNSRFDHAFRRGHYEFLRVEYLNDARPVHEWPLYLWSRPQQSKWEVLVQPVPRRVRHAVRLFIVDSAFPQVAEWLLERAQLCQRGNDVLAFFYDEQSEECIARRLTRLEPIQ